MAQGSASASCFRRSLVMSSNMPWKKSLNEPQVCVKTYRACAGSRSRKPSNSQSSPYMFSCARPSFETVLGTHMASTERLAAPPCWPCGREGQAAPGALARQRGIVPGAPACRRCARRTRRCTATPLRRGPSPRGRRAPPTRRTPHACSSRAAPRRRPPRRPRRSHRPRARRCRRAAAGASRCRRAAAGRHGGRD